MTTATTFVLPVLHTICQAEIRIRHSEVCCYRENMVYPQTFQFEDSDVDTGDVEWRFRSNRELCMRRDEDGDEHHDE